MKTYSRFCSSDCHTNFNQNGQYIPAFYECPGHRVAPIPKCDKIRRAEEKSPNEEPQAKNFQKRIFEKHLKCHSSAKFIHMQASLSVNLKTGAAPPWSRSTSAHETAFVFETLQVLQKSMRSSLVLVPGSWLARKPETTLLGSQHGINSINTHSIYRNTQTFLTLPPSHCFRGGSPPRSGSCRNISHYHRFWSPPFSSSCKYIYFLSSDLNYPVESECKLFRSLLKHSATLLGVIFFVFFIE